MTLEDVTFLFENKGKVKSEQDASEIKLEEIIRISREYERLISEDNGLTRYQAAEKLGYTPQQIDEMYKKARRITTQKSFRKSIKVDPSKLSERKTTEETKATVEPEKEK